MAIVTGQPCLGIIPTVFDSLGLLLISMHN